MKSVIVPEREFKVNEECGIIGIIAPEAKDIAKEVYFGLFALQHRGQESAGISVSYEPRKAYYYKKMGLVSEVFDESVLEKFPKAPCGIGHVRYSTSGSSNAINAQPVVFYGRYGRMSVAHNGNIINCDVTKSRLIREGQIFQSSIDAEVIAALINKYSESSVFDGVYKTCAEIQGAFAIVVMLDGKIIAARDAYGLKPLILGKKDGSFIVASETCALDALDAEYVRDIAPGEVICIDEKLNISSMYLEKKPRASCIFEYVYLARSDSVIDSVSVYDARFECGRMLAKLYKIDADLVAGVPDSAVVAARGYSSESGIPYIDALSKNRYIGRTFIQPSQSLRENSVRIKLNAFRSNIEGKRLILVDDSIVRGTTSKKIIQLLRANGAKEIHMIIASPIVCCPCFFGVDMETKDVLVGADRSAEEICKIIGADSLHYIPIDYLKKACSCGKDGNDGFCAACFDGKYPIDVTKYNCGKFVLEV